MDSVNLVHISIMQNLICCTQNVLERQINSAMLDDSIAPILFLACFLFDFYFYLARNICETAIEYKSTLKLNTSEQFHSKCELSKTFLFFLYENWFEGCAM